MSKVQTFFMQLGSKMKENRKLELIIYALLGIAVLAIFISSLLPKSKQAENTENISSQTSTVYESETDVENRLESVLSKIRGAGKVEVMITYETGVEIVPAMSSDKESTSSESNGNNQDSLTSNQSESLTPATISQSGNDIPIVLTEIKPKVRGVIVIAEGAADIMVKLDLQYAVQTVLGVPASCIEVFEMSKNNAVERK